MKVAFEDGSTIEIVGWSGGLHPKGMFGMMRLAHIMPDVVTHIPFIIDGVPQYVKGDETTPYEHMDGDGFLLDEDGNRMIASIEDRSPGVVTFWDYERTAVKAEDEPVTMEALEADAQQPDLANIPGVEAAAALLGPATSQDATLSDLENLEAPEPAAFKCPKCGASGGGDWSQCMALCPIQGSPFYNAATRASLMPDAPTS